MHEKKSGALETVDDDDVIHVEGAIGNDEDACDDVFDKGGDAQTDDKGKDA